MLKNISKNNKSVAPLRNSNNVVEFYFAAKIVVKFCSLNDYNHRLLCIVKISFSINQKVNYCKMKNVI